MVVKIMISGILLSVKENASIKFIKSLLTLIVCPKKQEEISGTRNGIKCGTCKCIKMF